MKLDLKLYRGYVNDSELVVFGHLFRSWAPDKYRIDRKGFKHAFSILHMFRIKPMSNIEIRLQFKNLDITTKTMEDGFFRFNVPFDEPLESGWHEYKIICHNGEFGIVEKGELLKPFESKLSIISDIDDTFLVSHSNSFFKKLYVMLSKNVNKRKTFSDVVQHYDYLLHSGQDREEGKTNSFFYVSSSEYNLYDFIVQFAQIQNLPKAVLKLKDIKTGLRDFFKTGRGDHDHKFVKIKDIIMFYPRQNYILLGDDSQHDAHIYERICKIFPKNIKAVYIRQTSKRKNPKIAEKLSNIESMGFDTCYFKSSSEAIAHSEDIGVVKSAN